VPGLEHEHAIARGERVGERGFPCAGAGRRVDDHRPVGLEDLLQPVEDRERQPRELGTAVIDRRMVERAQDPVRHVGRSRDLQEMAAAGMVVEAEHRPSNAKGCWHIVCA
jgi:hypothetical protein